MEIYLKKDTHPFENKHEDYVGPIDTFLHSTSSHGELFYSSSTAIWTRGTCQQKRITLDDQESIITCRLACFLIQNVPCSMMVIQSNEFLRFYADNGEYYIISIPFLILGIWVLDVGILIQGKHGLFTMIHPYQSLVPVSFRTRECDHDHGMDKDVVHGMDKDVVHGMDKDDVHGHDGHGMDRNGNPITHLDIQDIDSIKDLDTVKNTLHDNRNSPTSDSFQNNDTSHQYGSVCFVHVKNNTGYIVFYHLQNRTLHCFQLTTSTRFHPCLHELFSMNLQSDPGKDMFITKEQEKNVLWIVLRLDRILLGLECIVSNKIQPLYQYSVLHAIPVQARLDSSLDFIMLLPDHSLKLWMGQGCMIACTLLGTDEEWSTMKRTWQEHNVRESCSRQALRW
jgi:hypothetical protein